MIYILIISTLFSLFLGIVLIVNLNTENVFMLRCNKASLLKLKRKDRKKFTLKKRLELLLVRLLMLR